TRTAIVQKPAAMFPHKAMVDGKLVGKTRSDCRHYALPLHERPPHYYCCAVFTITALCLRPCAPSRPATNSIQTGENSLAELNQASQLGSEQHSKMPPRFRFMVSHLALGEWRLREYPLYFVGTGIFYGYNMQSSNTNFWGSKNVFQTSTGENN